MKGRATRANCVHKNFPLIEERKPISPHLTVRGAGEKKKSEAKLRCKD